MKKKIIVAIIIFALCISLTGTASAAKTSWNYSNYNHGSYVPLTGTFSTTTGYNTNHGIYTQTLVQFSLDSTNISAITDYNEGNGAHSKAKGKKCYLTIDVTSVRDNSLDPFSAYAVYTDLPDPKIDIENDDLFGNRNEESEVVVLGKLEEKNYGMITVWDDYRSSDEDTGEFRVQFAMSQKGVFDYNNLII